MQLIKDTFYTRLGLLACSLCIVMYGSIQEIQDCFSLKVYFNNFLVFGWLLFLSFFFRKRRGRGGVGFGAALTIGNPGPHYGRASPDPTLLLSAETYFVSQTTVWLPPCNGFCLCTQYTFNTKAQYPKVRGERSKYYLQHPNSYIHYLQHPNSYILHVVNPQLIRAFLTVYKIYCFDNCYRL